MVKAGLAVQVVFPKSSRVACSSLTLPVVYFGESLGCVTVYVGKLIFSVKKVSRTVKGSRLIGCDEETSTWFSAEGRGGWHEIVYNNATNVRRDILFRNVPSFGEKCVFWHLIWQPYICKLVGGPFRAHGKDPSEQQHYLEVSKSFFFFFIITTGV